MRPLRPQPEFASPGAAAGRFISSEWSKRRRSVPIIWAWAASICGCAASLAAGGA